MKVELNRDGFDDAYLTALNVCFQGWGGPAEYDWHFRRPFGERRADRFVILDGGEPIAGSGVSWRELIGADGVERTVGVMTGSWTLPPARGRGCFRRLMDASRRLCVEREASWLLAFVVEGNASRRALEQAGALKVPTHYLRSPESAPPPASRFRRPRGTAAAALREEWQARSDSQAGCTRFLYRDFELWRRQFVERPLPTELIELEGAGMAVVEQHPTFDRILSVLASSPAARMAIEEALCARAIARRRRFFTFSTSAAYADRLKRACGLEEVRGRITILSAAEPAAPAASSSWFVEGGDRM